MLKKYVSIFALLFMPLPAFCQDATASLGAQGTQSNTSNLTSQQATSPATATTTEATIATSLNLTQMTNGIMSTSTTQIPSASFNYGFPTTVTVSAGQKYTGLPTVSTASVDLSITDDGTAANTLAQTLNGLAATVTAVTNGVQSIENTVSSVSGSTSGSSGF